MTAALDEDVMLEGFRITHVVNASNKCAPNKFAEQLQYWNVDVDDRPTEGDKLAEEFVAVTDWMQEVLCASLATGTVDSDELTIVNVDPRLKQVEDGWQNCVPADSVKTRVLVHCMCGVSRSASLVIAFLMRKRGYSLLKALRHVKEKRPVAKPNAGFLKALVALEDTLLEDGTVVSSAQEREELLDMIERLEKEDDASLNVKHACNALDSLAESHNGGGCVLC